MPTDVDTFRTLLPGEDHPLEAEVSTFISSRLEEAHPFEPEVSLTFRSSRSEEEYPFEQEVSTFGTLKPEDPTVATVHPLEQQEVQVIASPGAPFSELRQSLKSGALEGGESTPHSPKDILVETSPISLESG